MQATFTKLQNTLYKHFTAFRGICIQQQNLDSALASFIVALLEIVFKYRGSLPAQELLSRIQENFKAVQGKVSENDAVDFQSAVTAVDNLNNASYVKALEWLEYYVTKFPSMIRAVVVWMKLNLENQDEDAINELESVFKSLKKLAGIFEVGLEIINREDETCTKFPMISLYFNEENNFWYIFYSQTFISESRQLSLEGFSNRKPLVSSEKLVNKIVSVLQNKKLSQSSLTKLRNFYTKNPDRRIQALLSNYSSAETEEILSNFPITTEKCTKCRKPLKSLSPFTTFCPFHPICPNCLEISASCKTCKKDFSSTTISLQHILLKNNSKS